MIRFLDGKCQAASTVWSTSKGYKFFYDEHHALNVFGDEQVENNLKTQMGKL